MQALISRAMMSILIVVVGLIANNYSVFWGMILNASVALVAFIGFLYARLKNKKLAMPINI